MLTDANIEFNYFIIALDNILCVDNFLNKNFNDVVSIINNYVITNENVLLFNYWFLMNTSLINNLSSKIKFIMISIHKNIAIQEHHKNINIEEYENVIKKFSVLLKKLCEYYEPPKHITNKVEENIIKENIKENIIFI